MKQEPKIPLEGAERFFIKDSPTYLQIKRSQDKSRLLITDNKEIVSQYEKWKDLAET